MDYRGLFAASIACVIYRLVNRNVLLHSLTSVPVLAALAHQLDGSELSDRGRKIQEATLIGPTLFPLAFAALGGRSIKRIALWRAERGTTLGVSSRLAGS